MNGICLALEKNLLEAATELQIKETDMMKKLCSQMGPEFMVEKVKDLQILAKQLESLNHLEQSCRSNLGKI